MDFFYPAFLPITSGFLFSPHGRANIRLGLVRFIA